jgi:hypothetical protein
MVNINRLWIRIVDNPIPPIPVDFAAMLTVVEKNLWKKKRFFQVYFVNRKTFYIK